MNIEIVLLPDMKEPQQPDRVFLEEILRRNSQPFAVYDKAAERAPAGAPTHPGKPPLVLLVGFENGAEDPGQVADVLGDEEVMLHEALDPAAARVGGVSHPPADLGLQVECPPLLGATCA